MCGLWVADINNKNDIEADTTPIPYTTSQLATSTDLTPRQIFILLPDPWQDSWDFELYAIEPVIDGIFAIDMDEAFGCLCPGGDKAVDVGIEGNEQVVVDGVYFGLLLGRHASYVLFGEDSVVDSVVGAVTWGVVAVLGGSPGEVFQFFVCQFPGHITLTFNSVPNGTGGTSTSKSIQFPLMAPPRSRQVNH